MCCTRCEELEEELLQLKEHLFGLSWRPPAELRLTAMERTILGALLATTRARSKTFLVAATRCVPGAKRDFPDPKMMDTKICQMRPRLKALGIEIETVWGEGWKLTPESRARLLNWNAQVAA